MTGSGSRSWKSHREMRGKEDKEIRGIRRYGDKDVMQ